MAGVTIDRQRYDAIVIGSGLGGLTAGALAAKNGARVLVVERHKIIGGAAHVFGRPHLVVETGLHEMDGFDEDDIKQQLFKELDLHSKIKTVHVPEFYAISHSALLGEPFVMPCGIEAGKAVLIKRFPQHKRSINTWFKLALQIRKDLKTLWENQSKFSWWLINGPVFPLRFWWLVRYGRTTLGKMLHKLFDDDEAIKLALTANASYYTDDADNMSLLFFFAAQGSYYQGGGHFVRGGSIALTRALAGIIKVAGGQVLTRREARQILLNKGKAAGIVHASPSGTDSKQVFAPIIFGNAAPNVLRDMLPQSLTAEKFWKPFAALQPSTSLWTVYLGVTRPPSEFGMSHYSNFFYPSTYQQLSDLSSFSDIMAFAPGEQMPGYVVVNYELIDAGLADKGQYLVVICGLDRLSNWSMLERKDYERKKQAWLEALVADIGRRFPGIAAHITYQEMATSYTVHRYMNTPNGAVYGFDQVPAQAGQRRPGPKTKIPGLYLASAYSKPGGGFTGAMLAGHAAWQAAKRRFN